MRGRTSASTRAVSSAVQRVLTGTTAAPARQTPIATTGQTPRFGSATATRSPRPTPRPASPAAMAAERSASSARERRWPVAPSTTAGLSGSAAA